jgi:SAM-dependent methyltransferase
MVPMTQSTHCPVCASEVLTTVVEIHGVPALCNAFAETSEEARAMPRGDIELVSCGRCSMLHNSRFDPTLAPYDSAYENSLHFSPRFQAYAEHLARGLGERFGRPGGTVVEIGSGAGDFLAMVAPAFGRGVGLDPSLVAARELEVAGASLAFLPGTLADAPADLVGDLVVCRHVLEHVPEPVALLRDARVGLGHDRTNLYVEVPDAEYMLRAPAVWDLIYEHVGYFTDAALRAALAAAGWRTVRSGTSFGGQYRWAEATLADEPDGELVARAGHPGRGTTRADACRFGRVYRQTVERWSRFLETEQAAGRLVAVWGAGSKGVAFANAMGSPLAAMVDINPRKHGRFVPGTGCRIVAPEDVAVAIDTVLVMNPLYLREVERAGAAAGLGAAYLAVD